MMRRKSRASEDFKQFILSERRREHVIIERKRKLYNQFFHKSLFYRSSLAVRLLYVLLFVIVFCFYKTSSGFRNEVYRQFYVAYQTGGKYAKNEYHLITDHHTYRISTSFTEHNDLHPGDIVNVEHNIFGKPIYFKKEGWDKKYGIYKNYIYFYILLFATGLTFFFNDGLDFFTNKLLYLFYAVDLISIVAFFII
jgi:hypothetical protein